MSDKKPKLDMKHQIYIFKRIMSFIKGSWAKYITINTVDIIANLIFVTLNAYIIGNLFGALRNNEPDRFIIFITVYIVTIAVYILIDYKFHVLFRELCERIACKIRKFTFAHMVELPISDYEATHTGDLLSRLTNDANVTRGIYERDFKRLLFTSSELIVFSIYVLTISWQAFIIALTLGAITMIAQTFYAKYVLKHSRSIQKATGDSTRLFIDILGGAWVIRMFGLQNFTDKLAEQFYGKIKDLEMKRIRQYMFRNLVTVSFNSIMIGSTMITAIILFDLEIISFVNIVVVSTLTLRIANSILYFGDGLVSYQRALAGAERIVEILDKNIENISKKDNEFINDTAIDYSADIAIDFNNLQFAYDVEKPIFTDFTTTLEKGKMMAIVGMSGGGKSTLFKLLMGFYQPSGGDIIIFGKNYRQYDINELRKLMSYVPQENYLFAGTIKENIVLAKPDATDDEIIKVAIAAHAHEFILETTDGYDTEVGERGIMLSGGQRQRIAIARALLKDAPILLLDEATASLDTESERDVQLAIEELMKGRSTIVVAHRLSTIENADKIVVLEDGVIKEEGIHSELLEQNKRYSWYYDLQFKIQQKETI